MQSTVGMQGGAKKRSDVPTSQVLLFGSRVDDTKKGGDIDLFIEPQHLSNEFEQKIILITKLQLVLGDQKIDVVLAKDVNRLIEKEARKKGVLL